MTTNLDKACCGNCGWLVAAEGVTIPVDLDRPREGAKGHRCDDCACESERVVTVSGGTLVYA